MVLRDLHFFEDCREGYEEALCCTTLEPRVWMRMALFTELGLPQTGLWMKRSNCCYGYFCSLFMPTESKLESLDGFSINLHKSCGFLLSFFLSCFHSFIFIIFLFLLSGVLRIKPRAFPIVDKKSSATVLHSHNCFSFSFRGVGYWIQSLKRVGNTTELHPQLFSRPDPTGIFGVLFVCLLF